MSSSAHTRKLVLIERMPNGSLRKIPLTDAARWGAKAGAQYAVIDGDSGAAPKGLLLKRQGQSLVIELQDPAEQITITEFYDEPGATFLPQGTLAGDSLTGSAITATSPAMGTAASGEPLIWRATSDSDGITPLQAGFGALGLGAVALGLGSASASGDDQPTAPVVVNTVQGTVVGGPVVADNGLTVVVYQADGVTKLGEAKVNADGSFSVSVGSYQGVIIAKAVDADTGADYLDEATESGKDLNAELFSMEVITTPNSTVVVNLNVLTTLAYSKALEAASGAPLDAEAVTATNTAIAELFGLQNLQSTTVTTTNGGSFNGDDGLSQGETYGAVLAALSGADDANGGDSQQTLDALLAGITLGPGGATLSQAAQEIVIEGAALTSSQTGTDLTGGVATIVDTHAPEFTSGSTATAINENSDAGQVIYTAAATDPAPVSYSLKAGGDAALLSINASTGAVTLTGAPDHETKASYSFTVVATDAAGNASEQAVTLAINDLDDTAPTFTSGATASAINENSGSGQVIYTATSTDSADVVSGSTSYSLKTGGDAALFSINASTGAVTLTGNPDHEAKASYSFTVIATDAAGNASEQTVALAINDLDESAPTITSGTTATAINENSGAGQVVYTATSTDAGDVATGSTSYSLKTGGDAALFSINTSTGAVTLTGNPDHEAKASYTFTVVATDAAGNFSEQAVSLTINDLDESAPTITSGTTATAINENSGTGQTIYTATSTDAGDVATGSTSYSLKTGGDATLFSINASNGAVTLTGNPDHETKASYSFTVVATDATGNFSEQAVTLGINDLDESAPTITSGGSATAINENSGTGQVVYTATSTDVGDVATGSTNYSLKTGGDAALFSINTSTGAVTLTGNPDNELKASYSFTVVATDSAGNASEQAVSLAINDLDDSAPTITSGATATAINENSGSAQVVYTATSTDSADVATGSTSYSLKTGGDAALFSINASTGAVTLTGNPDHELKADYSFTVVATDAAGNASEQAVTLDINDLDDSAPTITSGATATAINENSGAGQLVYTATSTDAGDVATGSTSYSLKTGGDAALFSINASSGAVTLTGNPDHEAKASYSFTVVATDAAGNDSEQAVTLGINDLDESAPTITSGATATAINENSGAGQVVYTVTSTDAGDVSTGSTSYSLKTGGDAALFSINASTGAVTLTGNPDFETKASYNFTVVATDAAGNASEQAITLAINDLADETAPSVSSIAISGASGPFNAGDTLSVTVTMDEATVVNTTGGTPRVALSMGANTVYATYASGSNSTSLVFNYTVQSGDTDANGVSIGANALQLNGGTLRDAAGNAASLSHAAVGDSSNHVVDTTTPSITSSGTATAINENSGAGQTIYTASATDASALSYSLKAVGDQASLSINSSSGAVTLTGNPDFETKASYSFTVVATDAAGNASERAVTLAINDVDDVAPTVSSVAISGASGAQNSRLNAGDVVSVTVTMSEAVAVTGTPLVALTLGSSTVQAQYVSGSSSTTLVFQYTVQSGDTDASGISIAANALTLNGGTLQDIAGNNATLAHNAVLDNANYLVDTAAPTLTSSTPADGAGAVAVGNNIELTFNETVLAGTGNIVISNGTDTKTISVTDTNQVTISGSTVTINPTADLAAGSSYNVQMVNGVLTDQAGNPYAGISNATTLNFDTAAASSALPNIVVFDLVQGVSSSHSSRTFDAGTTYTLYIRVNSTGPNSIDGVGDGPSDTWGMWSGANNLGADDKVILVGSGTAVQSNNPAVVVQNVYRSGQYMGWTTGSYGMVASLSVQGALLRDGPGVDLFPYPDLWDGNWNIPPVGTLNQHYLFNMPAGVLTSQGLAAPV